MPTKGDTKRKEILDYIIRYYNQNNLAPTVREIADGVRLKSPSSVHSYLKDLARMGYIELVEHRARSIQLTWRHNSDQRTVSVPLVGRIAAGVPVLAKQNIEENFTLPYDLAQTDNCYMLRVHGDSMIEVGILDGDMILVNPELHLHNGDIVAALIDEDTATVKRLFFQSDGDIRLQPENSAMAPMIFSPQQVTLMGKIVGVVRKYD